MRTQGEFVTIAIMYLAFFSLIGFSVYFLGSSGPLWALFLTPSYRRKGCKKEHTCPSCTHVFKDSNKDSNKDNDVEIDTD